MMNFSDYCKKVGLAVNTMLTPKISDTYGATRVSSSRHRNSTSFVVLHTTGTPASARNNALYVNNQEGRGESYHAVVDEYGVYEVAKFADVAHHAGNKDANCNSLGFELCDNNQDKGYPNFIKYVAYAMAQSRMVANGSTVKFHNEFVPTSCAAYLRSKGKAQIINDLNKYIAIAKGGSVPAPKPTEDKNDYVTKIAAFTRETAIYDYKNGKNIGTIQPQFFEGKLTYPIMEYHKGSDDIVIMTESYGKVRVPRKTVSSIYKAKGVQLKGDAIPVWRGVKIGEINPNSFGGMLDYKVLEVRENDLIINTEAYGKVNINNKDTYNIYG